MGGEGRNLTARSGSTQGPSHFCISINMTSHALNISQSRQNRDRTAAKGPPKNPAMVSSRLTLDRTDHIAVDEKDGKESNVTFRSDIVAKRPLEQRVSC